MAGKADTIPKLIFLSRLPSHLTRKNNNPDPLNLFPKTVRNPRPIENIN
jgi:hypothetical protein